LLFADEEDYDRLEQGQKWTLADIRERLENGDKELPLRGDDGEEITVLADFSDRERQLVLHGGVRRQLREQQATEAPGSKTEPADRGQESSD
jgi:hypothetical protein